MTSEFVLRLRAASPYDADALFQAGVLAVRNGEEDEALPLLERATGLHAGDARIWQVLGLAHRNREELAPAVAAFEKAVALAPGDPLLVHSLARSRLEGGLPAIEHFERALAMAPEDVSVQLGLVAARFAEGKLDDAIAGLEARLAQNPLCLPSHASLSRMRWLLGARADFAASFETAVAAAPGDVMIWREWIDLLLRASQNLEAVALLTRARAAAGPHPIFDGLEAVGVAESGDVGGGDRLFAALGPIEHIGMAVRYMRHLLRAGRPAEAAAFGSSWLADAQADFIWPYMSAAWRLTGNPRWQQLEGDERLIGVYDLDDALPTLPALAETLRKLHIAVGQPLDQSVRGGTQTDGALFPRIDPEIQKLRAVIVAAVERHIAQLPRPRRGHPTLIEKRAPIRFSGSWSVRLPGAGFHSNHIHPAGWLSSAFYVALPETMGGDRRGWLQLGEPQAELGVDLAPFRTIEPRPGRLVLFPSTMWHGTLPFEAGERLTVAFDVARPR